MANNKRSVFRDCSADIAPNPSAGFYNSKRTGSKRLIQVGNDIIRVFDANA